MFIFLSLVTSVKDYVEIVHKFVETDPSFVSYSNFGAVVTYLVLGLKEAFTDLVTLQWVQGLSSLPIFVPEISRSILSEISVLDSYFHNIFTFLENPVSYGDQNLFVSCIEKLTIGFVNSFFLILPTSTSQIITLRRFVMQGIEAGYMAGLGTIIGNLIWIGSVIFGVRWFVIPWLSLDMSRAILGFLLILKYMWDSYHEKKMVLEDLSKQKIFLLSFLLTLTEQTTLFPFITNLSLTGDSTIFESFPASNLLELTLTHGAYLGGLALGSFSLLHLTCWFFENTAFNLSLWFLSTFQMTTATYSKFLNVGFLYLTMICAVSNFSYFGLDYALANPLGLVHEDRIIDQKMIPETAFLSTKASDRNTRRNRGRHGRRERWKRRLRKYRTFDASLYDQGIYDLMTIEDLNYGFDRFWLRRKMRNHRVRFRFFPGPWMRSFKKQLAQPRLEGLMGPRVEFFRMLFEQVYHPTFHEKTPSSLTSSEAQTAIEKINRQYRQTKKDNSDQQESSQKLSTLRKFLRKFETRVRKAQMMDSTNAPAATPIESKQEEELKNLLLDPRLQAQTPLGVTPNFLLAHSKDSALLKMPEIEKYRNALLKDSKDMSLELEKKPLSLLHPAKFYLQKEKAFRRKLRFYGTKLFRKFGPDQNSPYFRIFMRQYFYYYKPTRRWHRTMQNGTLRKALRQKSRTPRRLIVSPTSKENPNVSTSNAQNQLNSKTTPVAVIQQPTHSYSVVSKRATRYRAQIYKDVLQHWYYSPMNRLFLKFDIDSFIRRQPKAHFLTKNEEQLLHLRRLLLNEHYDSLRWYTKMQHYETMKNQIGPTKSFANQVYQQQFQGTFKKIRHLFSLTPSSGTESLLKFDQNLYNEYPNRYPDQLIGESMLHEELLQPFQSIPETDVLNSANQILKTYLIQTQPIREQKMREFLESKNYLEFTKFLVNGQKTEIKPQGLEAVKNRVMQSTHLTELIIPLLQKYQSQAYDAEALKIYMTRHLEKQKNREAYLMKNLQTRLSRLKDWLKIHPQVLQDFQSPTVSDSSFGNLKTSLQKSFKETLKYQQSQIAGSTQEATLRPVDLIQYQKLLKDRFKQDVKDQVMTDRFYLQKEFWKDDTNRSSKIRHWIRKTWRSLPQTLDPSKIFKSLTKSSEIPSMDRWQKDETLLLRRKKTRKRMKRLKKKQLLKDRLSDLTNQFSFKTDDSLESQARIWNQWIDKTRQKWETSQGSNLIFSALSPSFKRKRSRRRGGARMRARSAIKKRTLGDTLKRQFRMLKRYKNDENQKLQKENVVQMLLTSQGASTASLGDPFQPSKIKIRRLHQRKHRVWKKLKRPKYAQLKRKLRKRRHSSLVRLRQMARQTKDKQNQKEIAKWWWQKFLVNYQAQKFLETNGSINNEATTFSLEKGPNTSVGKINGDKILKIGKKDVQPFQNAAALTEKILPSSLSSLKTEPEDTIQKLYENLFLNSSQGREKSQVGRKFAYSTNPVPFYAGWDETARKFVVTNRFLSREKAGYEMNFNSAISNLPKTFEFEKTPFKGMNAATTLYWQIPFTTYDPDQFFALGMDGFSPLGWRRFQFRHSKQMIQPILVKLLKTYQFETMNGKQLPINEINLTLNGSKTVSQTVKNQTINFERQKARRMIKRYRRIKKHPKPPVWFPSGPLAQQTLPVHYIYVFYKRFRLPRDRYIRRRLRRVKDGVALGMDEMKAPFDQFTVRRRVKPRRRYHRKRPNRAGEKLFPRRQPFMISQGGADLTKAVRRRPLPLSRLNQQIQDFEFGKLKLEGRQKLLKNKDMNYNARVRQLRRRIQRQVLRPLGWRYQPRPGGFVWPGDYLRLEAVRTPQLAIKQPTEMAPVEKEGDSKVSKRQKRQKKRTIQEWQIQPKKYFIQKHNLKVLKKRLEKAQNFNQLTQKIQQMKILTGLNKA